MISNTLIGMERLRIGRPEISRWHSRSQHRSVLLLSNGRGISILGEIRPLNRRMIKCLKNQKKPIRWLILPTRLTNIIEMSSVSKETLYIWVTGCVRVRWLNVWRLVNPRKSAVLRGTLRVWRMMLIVSEIRLKKRVRWRLKTSLAKKRTREEI